VSDKKSSKETTGSPVLGPRNGEETEASSSLSVFGMVRQTSAENELVRLGIICNVSVVNEPLCIR